MFKIKCRERKPVWRTVENEIQMKPYAQPCVDDLSHHFRELSVLSAVDPWQVSQGDNFVNEPT